MPSLTVVRLSRPIGGNSPDRNCFAGAERRGSRCWPRWLLFQRYHKQRQRDWFWQGKRQESRTVSRKCFRKRSDSLTPVSATLQDEAGSMMDADGEVTPSTASAYHKTTAKNVSRWRELHLTENSTTTVMAQCHMSQCCLNAVSRHYCRWVLRRQPTLTFTPWVPSRHWFATRRIAGIPHRLQGRSSRR